jgi:hypothetical protein
MPHYPKRERPNSQRYRSQSRWATQGQSLFRDPQAEVWGVLYRLTRRDLIRFDATEGIPWSWYRPHWLDAEGINGSPSRAMTYTATARRSIAARGSATLFSCAPARRATVSQSITSAF